MKKINPKIEKSEMTPIQEAEFRKFVDNQEERLKEYISGREALGNLISEKSLIRIKNS